MPSCASAGSRPIADAGRVAAETARDALSVQPSASAPREQARCADERVGNRCDFEPASARAKYGASSRTPVRDRSVRARAPDDPSTASERRWLARSTVVPPDTASVRDRQHEVVGGARRTPSGSRSFAIVGVPVKSRPVR